LALGLGAPFLVGGFDDICEEAEDSPGCRSHSCPVVEHTNSFHEISLP
jgi:hypothetical protein